MSGLRWSPEQLAAFEARGGRVLSRQRPATPPNDNLRPGDVHHHSDRQALASRAAEAEIAAHQSKPKRQRPEQDLQKAAVQLLRAALPPEWRVVHVPNGGWRSKIEAAIMKAMGVSPGFPDLSVFRPSVGPVAGGLHLVIELKARDRGRLSEAQEDWRDWFLRQGVPWALCRSIDDVIAACQDAGVPLRVAA